jgi:dTDP-4-dehydrorhamnose reductase
MHLVVGGDSLVGSALAARLRADGDDVLVTTRRRDHDGDALFLDLESDSNQWQLPRNITVAFLCAGVTRIQACEKDPARSARINVAGIPALAQRLHAAGTFVIYLSTNQVFDGAASHVKPEAPYSATTEYGRQKAAAEKKVRALGSSVAVVRFTKIFSDDMPVIRAWSRALRDGEAIQPFSDLVMAPVPLAVCVEALLRVGNARAIGITQVSADRDITYAEAGSFVARRLGTPEESVKPIESRDSGVSLGPPRLHTTLDTSRLRRELKVELPSVWETLDRAISAPQELRP